MLPCHTIDAWMHAPSCSLTVVRYEGLAELSKVRPENPIEWLAAYLLKNKDM